MKKLMSFILIFTVALCSASLACPVADKFKSGAKDVITSPMQVHDNVMAETKDAKFLPFALIGGLIKGTFYMGKQIVTGTYDMVTSPLEVRKYKK